jgi:hypothetical protein
MDKSFLLLFFKKEALASLPMRPKERKRFFFEKMNRKAFVHLVRLPAGGSPRMCRSRACRFPIMGALHYCAVQRRPSRHGRWDTPDRTETQ